MNCPFELHDNYLELCILVDHSSVEVYVNHGEKCITYKRVSGRKPNRVLDPHTV